MKQVISLAITPGAEDGVGPELLLKAIFLSPSDHVNYIWCGDQPSLSRAAQYARLKLELKSENSAFLGGKALISFMGEIKESSLLIRQAIFLKNCIRLALDKQADAILTGPIDKNALVHLDQGQYTGQTEYFAHHLAQKTRHPFMAFLGGPFMLSLFTTHIPLNRVSASLSEQGLLDHLLSVAHHCASIQAKKISDIRIALLGLNPHAGENGLLGREEEDVIKPTIMLAKARGLCIEGPLPADGFFTYFHQMNKEQTPDAVVAIYHDQGLIPYKLLAKGKAVNVTLGLCIPRTSPAHGTAKDLLGKNIACPLSSQRALALAIDLAKSAEVR